MQATVPQACGNGFYRWFKWFLNVFVKVENIDIFHFFGRKNIFHEKIDFFSMTFEISIFLLEALKKMGTDFA